MKKVIIILQLFTVFTGLSQVKMDKQQWAVIEIELSKRTNSAAQNRYVGDSLLVNIEIMPYIYTFTELAEKVKVSGVLSENEREEIFGTSPSDNYIIPSHPTSWADKDFKNRIVTFYKGDKEIAKRKYLSVLNVLSISVPIIRRDKKFAVIQTSNEHEGGVLHIYKNIDEGWVHYKKSNYTSYRRSACICRCFVS